MLRFRALPLLAVRRMAGNWRLLSSVVVGTLTAATIISSTAIYSDAIRDLGLEFALGTRDRSALDVELSSAMSVDGDAYRRSLARTDAAVERALRRAGGAGVAGAIRTGTSATFFPTAPGGDPGDALERPRAFLRFRSGLDEHVTLVEGSFPAPAGAAQRGAVEVAIGAETAARSGVGVGDVLELHPFWNADLAPLEVEVAGIVVAADTSDPYWRGIEDVLDDRSQEAHAFETYALLVPEQTFFGALAARASGATADFTTAYRVRLEALDSRNAPAVADGVRALERTLAGTERDLRVRTELVEVLDSYDQKLFFTRIPLLVLLLQIGGIVAYYLVMVSTMLVDRQASEMVMLRSRGASTAQLLFAYAVEGLILALLAALLGPLIAAAAISALGPTPPFSALSGGGLLDVHVSVSAYLLAGAGALLAFASFVLPAWSTTRRTMPEFRRAQARPRPTPAFLRYYLDVALVLVAALAFWRLSQQRELFSESFFGDLQVDPFLLLAPAVFLVTVGIVFLRVFPLIMRAFAAVMGLTRSVAVLVGMRSLVRNPTHYTRLILLLMFATGVGMFGASFSATLERSYEERSRYAVGADVRAAEFTALAGAGRDEFAAAAGAVPADVTSPAARVEGEILVRGQRMRVQFLAVEPETFREVGYFRDDFAAQPFDSILDVLEANGVTTERPPLPPDARQVGAWVKMPQIRGSVTVAVMLRDGGGAVFNYALGTGVPGGAVTEGWQFMSADLRAPRAPPRLFARSRAPVPPLSLDALYVVTHDLVAASQGRVLLGAVLATAEPPPPEPPLEQPPAEDIAAAAEAAAAEAAAAGAEEEGEGAAGAPPPEPFSGAVLVHDFAAEQDFEVIGGYRPSPPPDNVTASLDAPPGFERSVSYGWIGGSLRPPIRGVRVPADAPRMSLFLSRGGAEDLRLAAGDDALVSVRGKFVDARVEGVLEYFPTFPAAPGAEPFAIVSLSRLEAAVNSGPARRPLSPTEAWYSSDDPSALRAALEGEALDAQLVLDVRSERFKQQQDPLIAAGWQGILAIAFAAVLLLSAIGFLVYSYLSAQERSLELAILRTLGFSRLQVFSLVAFEHLFVIVAGMGLGTLVGLQVGRMMMDFLATDEQGNAVLPPFVLGVEWPSVILALGILGAVFAVTIGAVVLLYWRLAVHRVLRIGDA